jgi:hypothetical protein
VGISISELRGAQPADATLQNLLGVLNAKLELCSRLPIYEYEAGNEGHEECAAAFRALAEVERRSFDELLDVLRRHLDAGAKAAEQRDEPGGGSPTRGNPGLPTGAPR